MKIRKPDLTPSPVNQEHAALRLLQRLQQRARLDELLGEEHVTEIMELVERGIERGGAAQHFAELVLQDLRVEKLLGVFPFIERLGFIQPLIALQADHLQAAPGGDRFGKLGLADAGRSLHQDGLAQVEGHADMVVVHRTSVTPITPITTNVPAR